MGFIAKENRTLAPQWLLKFHSPSSVVYVNYWSYSCRPCLAELPFLSQLQGAARKDSYRVLLFNVDRGEDMKRAKNHLSEVFPHTQSIYSHSPSWREVEKVRFLPYHQIIDKNGYMAMEFIGEIDVSMQSRIKSWIQTLVQEPKS